MIQRKEKPYWKMSILEKQVKYNDLPPIERYKLHHEQLRNFIYDMNEQEKEVQQQITIAIEKKLIPMLEKELNKILK